nr:immunoglobulin heavy chain junction region [Mus musculus]
TVQERGGTLTT